MTETYPIETCSAAALPLLIDARRYLYALAAPKASRLEERITAILADIIYLSSDVVAYENRWGGDSEFRALAGKLADATAEYDRIGRGE